MRSTHVLFFLSFLTLTAGVCLWLSGCDQEPLSLAPETEFRSWTRRVPEIMESFSAVWGAAADDIYATTLSGSIYHFDGSKWSSMDVPLNLGLNDIWGTSSSDVYAVGPGIVLTFGGSSWTVAYRDPKYSTSSTFWSFSTRIWGSSSSDVYVSRSWSRYKTVHFDGTSWGEDSLLSSNEVGAIWGSSSTNVYAAAQEGKILHYNGISWDEEETGATVSLVDVWGTGGSDVFAVSPTGGVFHSDGSAWSILVAEPADNNSQPKINRIWGSAPGDVYLFGERGLMRHYDGSSWETVASPTVADLVDGWGSNAASIVAVGDNGKIIRYGGTRWSGVTPGWVRATYLWGASDFEIFLGDSRVVFRYHPNEFEELPPYTEPLEITNIWAASRSDLFAVGPYGKIFHFNGTTWSPMASDTDQRLNAVWGADPNDVYAVGDEGTVVHFDGSGWGSVLYDTGRRYTDVWGSSGRDVFVVGTGGIILHFNGAVWSRQKSGTSKDLSSIWGASSPPILGPYSQDVYVVPWLEGFLLHYDGDSWRRVSTGGDKGLVSVYGSRPDDVWAAGYGRIVHFNGEMWTPHKIDSRYWFQQLWCGPSGAVYAIGSRDYEGYGLYTNW